MFNFMLNLVTLLFATSFTQPKWKHFKTRAKSWDFQYITQYRWNKAHGSEVSRYSSSVNWLKMTESVRWKIEEYQTLLFGNQNNDQLAVLQCSVVIQRQRFEFDQSRGKSLNVWHVPESVRDEKWRKQKAAEMGLVPISPPLAGDFGGENVNYFVNWRHPRKLRLTCHHKRPKKIIHFYFESLSFHLPPV